MEDFLKSILMFLFRNENYRESLNSFMKILKFLGSLYSVRIYYPLINTDENIKISNWFDIMNYLSTNQFLVKFLLFGIFFFIIYDMLIIVIRLIYNQLLSPFREYSNINKYLSTENGKIYLSKLRENFKNRYSSVNDKILSNKDFVMMLRSTEIDFVKYSSLFVIIIVQLEVENIFKFTIFCFYLIILLLCRSILRIFEDLFLEINKEIKNEPI